MINPVSQRTDGSWWVGLPAIVDEPLGPFDTAAHAWKALREYLLEKYHKASM